MTPRQRFARLITQSVYIAAVALLVLLALVVTLE